ncbi:uncharacterized protein LOC135366587 isoform X1 [Ornithodoros turicata]|uniref:uncharacterized protein LOC135366587 isoform X1 n=1 Tax=Ornithodoros turicata TaxID=34597 RepID=UPI003139056C
MTMQAPHVHTAGSRVTGATSLFRRSVRRRGNTKTKPLEYTANENLPSTLVVSEAQDCGDYNDYFDYQLSPTTLNSGTVDAGLTKTTFLALLAVVAAVVPWKRKNLPCESQLLLLLMRLRLGLQVTDLAYRFNVSIGTASRIFKLWLGPVASVCRTLIVFPKPDVARSWLTDRESSHFPNLKGIIDCSEVPVSRPYNLSTQLQVWSNYKQDSTLKFLVCVNPHGCITFISKAFGGRISDKEITVESGFLELLLPGDQILADRGFLLHQEFFHRNVQLITPAFTKGRTQLLPSEVESSRRISSSRIIVERTVGHLKKWKVLSNTVSYTVVKHFDDILTIIAGLTNTAPSLLREYGVPATDAECP